MDSFKPEAGTYEILEKVGEGLTSTVYKAVRLDSRGHSRQIVALKVLQDETTIPILRREFESLARVRSQNCGRVLAWENSGNRPALALEWIDGFTLDRLPWALDEGEITEIASQVAQGLRDLRDQRLHHGDLHPRNVIVDANGLVRLVDFGTGESIGGEVRGAPAYLAPEIWSGAPTSYAADLFALGAMLYDLERAFSNTHHERRDEILARSGDPLLDPNPQFRNYPSDSHSDPVMRARLGEKIARHLLKRPKQVSTQILPLETSRRAWAATVAASLLAGLTTLSISVRAEAPLESAASLATLEIRSNRWLELEINGKSAGFAPIRLETLKPGFHRLKWRGAAGAGEVRLQFESGAIRRLDEGVLKKLADDLKH